MRRGLITVFLVVSILVSSVAVVLAQQSASFSYTIGPFYSVDLYVSPTVSELIGIESTYGVDLYVSSTVSVSYGLGAAYYDYLPALPADVILDGGTIGSAGAAVSIYTAPIRSGGFSVGSLYGAAYLYQAPIESSVPGISAMIARCMYGGGTICRIVDCNGTVLDEPYDPWTVDLQYRLPIVYILMENVSEVIVVIDSPTLASWIWGNGTVGVAIDGEPLTTDLFDVYIVGFRYVEVAIYAAPKREYGFIYLYYGKGGSSMYTEPVFMKAEVDEETLFVQECLVLQIGAVEVPLPPLPPMIPTETPVATTTAPPVRTVEIPWWLLLLILLLLLLGAARRRREEEEQV